VRFAAGLLFVLVVLAGCAGKSGGPEAVPAPSSTSSSAPPSSSGSTTSAAPPSPVAPPPQTVGVTVEGAYPANPHFTPDELEVRSGATVTVEYTDNDLNPLGSHNWYLDGVGVVVGEVPTGQQGEGTFVAPAPGDYAFYCSLQGHREAGMEGVLHVTA
jgi:plastocyanin